MVDLLSENYDIVARYQGGNNAGHTVQNHLGKFILNLLPSGILRPNVVNVMGPGMVIDLQHLCGEIDRLRQAGISITPDNLKISDRAIICLPYHVQQDGLEEDRLGDAKYGSTRRGIAPVYGDKYLKKCIRMGDLLYPEAMKKRLRGIVEWKDLLIHDGYKADHISYDEIISWLETYGGQLKDHVCDLGVYLTEQIQNGKSIMFEAQLGALPGHRLWHLSFYFLFFHYLCLRSHRRWHPWQKAGSVHRYYEGVLLLRGRRPLHL